MVARQRPNYLTTALRGWVNHSGQSTLMSHTEFLARYIVSILSNQGSIGLKTDSKLIKNEQKSLANFKSKASSVFNQLGIPILLLAATARDQYRKPRVGMWTELLEEIDLDTREGPVLGESFFVGDAGGRAARSGAKADHSCSDRSL